MILKFPLPLHPHRPSLFGMRTCKTVLAVLFTSLFMKYVLHDTPFFACIGAVVAMERTLSSSFKAVVIRNVGTLTGGLVGIAVSSFTQNIALISLGLVPMIYINNRVGKRESIVPGAIVYFAVAYLNTMDTALYYGLRRILGTFIGSLIGIGVNALLFPPKPEELATDPLPETNGIP